MNNHEEYLTEENRQLRNAGCKLAEAALQVIREYDGLHRLALAVSEWLQTIAKSGIMIVTCEHCHEDYEVVIKNSTDRLPAIRCPRCGNFTHMQPGNSKLKDEAGVNE